MVLFSNLQKTVFWLGFLFVHFSSTAARLGGSSVKNLRSLLLDDVVDKVPEDDKSRKYTDKGDGGLGGVRGAGRGGGRGEGRGGGRGR